MPRLHKSRHRSTPSQSSIHNRSDIENEPPPSSSGSNADQKTKLAPSSSPAAMRSKANGASPEPKYNLSSQQPTTANGSNAHIPSTIRTVPSFDVSSEPSSYESPSARNSGFSSSIHSSASAVSDVSHESQSEQSASTVRIKPQSSPPPRLGSPINISEDLITSPALSDAPSRMEETMAEASLQVPSSNYENDRFAREGSPQQWDGAVGKAALGKTGRVINKLVSDNEALKRDIQIERIKSEEAKQAAKLIEDKMERMATEYDSRMLEANVTKTLLHRKERQVESLQSAVELEKKRTADAQERERTWREELERGRREANVQVEEANTQAALMEGRYNAIASHWKDQGAEVERAVSGLTAKIEALNAERKTDDDRINTLRDLCDQQDGNIRDLLRQKDDITRAFDGYKRQQDAMLKGIKESAHSREEEQARTIEETKRVLGQLKWALNVKQNVKGAQ